MKKITVAAFALISITANAQKGSLLVSGSFNIGTSKNYSSPTNYTTSTGLSFSPAVGYQFNNNWTAGITANISTAKFTDANNIVSKSSNLAAGPFVRYTQKISDIFFVYGQLQGNFGTGKSNGTKTNSYTGISLSPAVFINIKNGFGLNFSFGGIDFFSNTPPGGESNTNFGLNFGQTAEIGVSKNFNFKNHTKTSNPTTIK